MGIFSDDGSVTSYWEQQANMLRGELVALAAKLEAAEQERDALIIAIEQEGLAVGSHGSGLCITDASLARLKAEWQGEVLDELGTWIIRRDECIDELDIEEFRLERSAPARGGGPSRRAAPGELLPGTATVVNRDLQENVMDNVIASLLGQAARASEPGGDAIDHGWSLLKELHKRGFDVRPQLGSQPYSFVPWHAKGKTLNQYCRLPQAEEG